MVKPLVWGRILCENRHFPGPFVLVLPLSDRKSYHPLLPKHVRSESLPPAVPILGGVGTRFYWFQTMAPTMDSRLILLQQVRRAPLVN